jgi:hypothetical protein
VSEQPEPRPLADVVRTLARARGTLAALQAIYDEDLAKWQEEHSPLIGEVTRFKDMVRQAEAEIRSRGAAIAASTRQAPCPGTKVRNQKVLRYVAPDANGELIAMDAAKVRAMMTEHIIAHGWTDMLKPDVATWEKAIKGLPEGDRPVCVREEWETVVSIDADLSPLLAEEG